MANSSHEIRNNQKKKKKWKKEKEREKLGEKKIKEDIKNEGRIAFGSRQMEEEQLRT